MKHINFQSVCEAIESSFFKMYKILDKSLQKKSGNTRLRSEQSKNENIIQYLLEIINIEKINEDDYGLVVCINIDHYSNKLVLRFEILKSDGLIFSIMSYELFSVDHDLFDIIELNNALLYIDSLPNILHSTYLSMQENQVQEDY